MTKSMFLDITTTVEAHDDYFVRKANTAGTWGFSHLQKVTAALRMLTYGGPADLFDEYIRMGELTMLESVRHFVRYVVEIYGPHYLRSPTAEELDMLFQKAESTVPRHARKHRLYALGVGDVSDCLAGTVSRALQKTYNHTGGYC
jgi:O-acetyl-ADP-ribose deacetylase (regulator of RNase III)